jgi:hypothetical protein
MHAPIRAVLSLILAVAGAGGAVLALSECTITPGCDATAPDVIPVGSGDTNASGTTWESVAIDQAWHRYNGEATVVFHPSFDGPYLNVLVYVSPDEQANNSNWTIASGNLGEVWVRPPGGDPHWTVSVHNDTCAPYFVRVVVERGSPDAGSPDAGAPDAMALDGGAPDAPNATEAGTDAPVTD